MAKSLDIIDPKKDFSDDHEDDDREETEDIEKSEKHNSSSGGIFYLILGIVAIIVATGAALYILFQDDGDSSDESSAKQSAVVSSVTATAEESVVASVIPNPSPDNTFTYSDESIRIANGNGISGEANRIKKILENAGYKIASVGNASKSYTESFVYFKSGQDSLAEAIKKQLSDEYDLKTEVADQIVGSYDAVIVLGSK